MLSLEIANKFNAPVVPGPNIPQTLIAEENITKQCVWHPRGR